MSRFQIAHETRFDYSEPISETVMEVRLRPLDGAGQRCLDFRLDVEPRVGVRSYRDGYGNHVHYFNLLRAHPSLVVTSRSLVDTGLRARRDADGDAPVLDYLRFRPPAGDVPGIRRLAAAHQPAGADPGAVEAALDGLALAISRDFVYDTSATNVHTSIEEVLRLGAGVCQDFAHLYIAAARALGVPARYVSGYIHVPGPDGVTEGLSHAWAEAWVEGRGWLGFDATHPIRAGANHVRVAVGRDYRDAAPTRGVYVGPATGNMAVRVTIRAPRNP